MARLFFGIQVFVNNVNGRWDSPTFIYAPQQQCGLYFSASRGTRPITWDKAGWVSLVARNDGDLFDMRISSQDALFDQATGFLFPSGYENTEFSLRFQPVEWVRDLQIQYGTVFIQ